MAVNNKLSYLIPFSKIVLRAGRDAFPIATTGVTSSPTRLQNSSFLFPQFFSRFLSLFSSFLLRPFILSASLCFKRRRRRSPLPPQRSPDTPESSPSPRLEC